MSEIPLKMIEGEYEIESQDSHSRPAPFVLDDEGNRKPKMLRVMTADQVRERIELQVERNTQFLRTQVLIKSPLPFQGGRPIGFGDDWAKQWDLSKPETREALKRLCKDDGA